MTEREIFVAALHEADAAARCEFLHSACGDDTTLRERVENLLTEHEQLGNFLEHASPLTAASESPTNRIGPYRLLQQIGEGGFGVIFMAEQLEPVRRLVAVKVIKPGMDTRQVIARFEAERQALAVMEHPNIVRVLDAGTAPCGRPFFVMEFVHGVQITKHCDEHNLTVAERLALFASVCRAIQHAHTRGIIHRDIKPTNVLVTQQDGEAVVKVIDFGIAKALCQPLTDKTPCTHFAQLIGTPLYMSPEQAELNAADIDTRSDIYSLGVLLYELLTGCTPFDQQQLRHVAFDEIRRIIREDEPPKPSTRISTAEAASSIAARRHTEPARLEKLVRGELDWIVMKALEKDRNRRYETASGLALDIQRYMTDEPVQAGPPSAGYRFRKFVRRNTAGLAIAALMLGCILLLGGGAGWWVRDLSARRAATAARVESALQEAARLQVHQRWPEARAATQRAELLLAAIDNQTELQQRLWNLHNDLQMIHRLEQVVEGQLRELDGFWDHAGADAAYEAAFRDYGIDLFGLDAATAAQRVRESCITEQLLPALDDWAWVSRGAISRSKRVRAVACLTDPDPWRVRFRDPAVQRNRAALEELASRPEVATQPATVIACLGRALNEKRASAKAVEVLSAAQRRHPESFWLNLYLGSVLRWGIKPPRHLESAGYMRAALALRPQALRVHLELGGSLLAPQHAEEAIAHFRRALEIQPDYAHAHACIGQAYALQRDWPRAIEAYLASLQSRIGPRLAARVHYDLGVAYRATGEWDQAIRSWQRTVQIDARYAKAYGQLGNALREQGRRVESVPIWKKLVELNPRHVSAHTHLAWYLATLPDPGLRDPAAAVVHAQRALELAPTPNHWSNLGVALYRWGNWDAAADTLEKADQLWKGDHRHRFFLAMACWQTGKKEKARQLYEQGVQWMDANMPHDEELRRFRTEAAELMRSPEHSGQVSSDCGRMCPPCMTPDLESFSVVP